MADVNLTGMTTETRNEASSDLDIMTSLEIVTLMNSEDSKIAAAVGAQLPEIAKAVDFCVDSLEKGGRIIYIGAGTSGRLGAIDAAECPPTFGVAPGTVVGLIAGGQSIDISLSADREDSPQCAVEDLSGIALNNRDTVVGVAASGRTPYVVGGLEYANSLGCHTVALHMDRFEEGQVNRTVVVHAVRIGILSVDILVGAKDFGDGLVHGDEAVDDLVVDANTVLFVGSVLFVGRDLVLLGRLLEEANDAVTVTAGQRYARYYNHEQLIDMFHCSHGYFLYCLT